MLNAQVICPRESFGSLENMHRCPIDTSFVAVQPHSSARFIQHQPRTCRRHRPCSHGHKTISRARVIMAGPALPSPLQGLSNFSNLGICLHNVTELIISRGFLDLRQSDSFRDRAIAALVEFAHLPPVIFVDTTVAPFQVTGFLRNLPSYVLDNVVGLDLPPILDSLRDSTAMLLHRAEFAVAQGISNLSPFFTEPVMDADDFPTSANQMLRMLIQICKPLGISPQTFTAVVLTTVVGFAIVSVLARNETENQSSLNGKNLLSRYDPDAIQAYFKKRPLEILSRSLQVVFPFSTFAASLMADKLLGLDKENEKVRAKQLVGLTTSLGPTAIKIGQALSIRPDILPVAYLEELQKLQDQVPPFSNDEAKELILEGLGKSAEEIFVEISAEPIAAASLGQVYKATLRDSGDLVAVKVQRPGLLEGISRDLYLLRIAAGIAQSLPNVQSDLFALLDNWASRFFDELDYVQEGKNALQFAENMKALPNIVVPNVFMQYTSRKVLTTEWVEGDKLSDSKAGDLLELVNVALNCYLMQLLESGFLHADPHPGNLLRTPNGCLCVLDFGLMTQITVDQKFAFVDYISHLVNGDYALVAEDLVKLGFVPPELVDPAKTASVVPQLSRVLGQLVQGGGARKVNFQQITEDLSNISRDYVFVIPPYFALILRAFSVLEGIGLKADPDYAIVNECYPYLSKRLLTDDSPRIRAALKYFLYAGKERLDVNRLEDIISGFQTFQKLTALLPKDNENINQTSKPPVDYAAKQVLYSVFSYDGSYLQELLLTELVRAVDALSRDSLAEIWQYFTSRALVSLPPALLIPKSWPIPLPGLPFRSSRVATLSNDDQQSLETVKRLWVLVEPQFTQRKRTIEMMEAAEGMVPFIFELSPGIVSAMQRFILMLLQRQALRLADDLDGNNSIAEWDKDPSAFARRIMSIRRFQG